jgi:hypothetical protein
MFEAELDESNRLLKIVVAGHVLPEEAERCLRHLHSLLADIAPGFRVLSDLSGIESMPLDTAPHIGQIMKLCTEKGIATVVRVLPSEPRKDIGYAILSQFHYRPNIRIINCATLEDAETHLAE